MREEDGVGAKGQEEEKGAHLGQHRGDVAVREALGQRRLLEDQTREEPEHAREEIHAGNLVVVKDARVRRTVETTDQQIVVHIPETVVEEGHQGELEAVDPAGQPKHEDKLRDGVDESELEVVEVDSDVLAAETLVEQVGRVVEGDGGAAEIGDEDVVPELLEEGTADHGERCDEEGG